MNTHDAQTISNHYHHTKPAADRLSATMKTKIPAFVIYIAKYKVGDNKTEIKNWIKDNRKVWEGLV